MGRERIRHNGYRQPGQGFGTWFSANRWNLFLLLCLALFTVWRQPGLFTAPRFWAEEGSLYFAYAYSHSFLQTLFHAELGYYTFYHGIVTFLATLFPLETAPAVTTIAAFLVQLGIGCLVLWGDIPLLNSRGKRAAVLFLIPMLCYARNWLNTLGVHFWLCILSFLLLMEAAGRERTAGNLFRWAMLAIAGLTGVTTCFMTPVFILKAYVTRSRRFLGYSVILAACSLIQILVFIRAWLAQTFDLGNRFIYNEPLSLVKKVLIYQFAEPFFGHLPFEHPFGIRIGKAINGLCTALAGASPFTWELEAAATAAGFVMLLFVGYLFCRTFPTGEYRYLIPAFLLVFVLSTLSSLGLSAGPRYTFAPNVMLMVFAVSLWDDARLTIARRAVMLLVCFSILIHAAEFRHSMYNLAYDDRWPQWTTEVRLWRTVPGYRPKIWPPPSDLWLEK